MVCMKLFLAHIMERSWMVHFTLKEKDSKDKQSFFQNVEFTWNELNWHLMDNLF